MFCPQCGTRNPVGRQRCVACSYPFTRAAARSTPGFSAAAQSPPRAQAEQQYQPQYQQPAPVRRFRPRRVRPRKRQGTFGCLLILMTTVGLLALLVVAGLIANDRLIQPMIVDRVGEEIERGIRTSIEQRFEGGATPEAPQSTSPTPATGESTDSGGTTIDQITISEADLNERLANSGNLGPVDQATINVAPDGIRVDLEAYGVPGTYYTDIHAENGRVILDGGSLEGPLGFVVPAGEVEQTANNAIASTLNDYGYQVEGVTLGNDAIALSVRQ